MPDQTLEILIKTKAELGGAEAAYAKLQADIGAAKALGKSYADLEAKAATAKKHIDDFKKSQGDAGEESKLFAGHMGEVKHAIRELSGEFPVAGLALRIMTNAIGGMVTAAIIGFGLAKKALEDWNKELDETAERLAKPDFLTAIEARKNALEAGSVAAAQHADAMAHLTNEEDRFQKAIDKSIALLHAQAAAANEIGEAKFGFDSENLKHQLDIGLISQEQYFIKLGELEKQHEQEKLAREKAEHQQEIALLDQGIERAKGRQPDLEKKAQSARTTASQAQAAADEDAELLKTMEGKKEEDAKAVAAVEEKIKKAGGIDGIRKRAAYKGIDPFANQEAPKAKALADEYDTALRIQNKHLSEADDIRKRLPEEKGNAALAAAAAARAAGRSEANEQRITDKGDERADKAAQFGIQDAGAAEAARIKSATTDRQTMDKLDKVDVGGGYTGGDAEHAAALEQFQRQGKALTDVQTQWLKAFQDFAISHGQTTQSLQNIMSRLTGTQNSTADKLAALDHLVGQLESRIQSIHNR